MPSFQHLHLAIQPWSHVVQAKILTEVVKISFVAKYSPCQSGKEQGWNLPAGQEQGWSRNRWPKHTQNILQHTGVNSGDVWQLLEVRKGGGRRKWFLFTPSQRCLIDINLTRASAKSRKILILPNPKANQNILAAAEQTLGLNRLQQFFCWFKFSPL